jgi:malonyl-CoA O-methyltransferase
VTLRLADALPEKRATRRAFDAAEGFEHACFIHDEARAKLLARLDYVALAAPRLAIDLGCATGRGASALALRYPSAQIVALDTSSRMLAAATRTAGARIAVVGGDAERLPLRAGSVDLALANLVLPWCRPDAVFAEAARVLKDGGLVLFATVGPDTLQEVRAAFGTVDRAIHVHAAFDIHDLGDMALAAGLAEPVLDLDRLEVTYSDLAALVRDLRAMGAVNVAGARRRGLTGIERWRGFERALIPRTGRLVVTVELIFGLAFGRGAGPRSAAGSPAEVVIPIDRLQRRSEST